LQLKSGRTLVGEVHSGSSYLTGSSTDLFFSIPETDETVSLSIRSPIGETIHRPLKNSSGAITVQMKN